MGAIYKVRHVLLEEVRVIKVLRPQLRSDERLRQRFLREARTAIRVRHPNIAQLYDCVIDEDNNAFIVMEFIEGITFQEMLTAGGPPALGLSLELAVQSLDALATIHRKGIIHRDISPDNIMFCADEDGLPAVKLIDLGIAKVLKGDGGLTETGTFLGKVRYASPEHFTGDGHNVDERSDLYSFGVVLYELVTGSRPFTGNDVASLIAAHLFRGPLGFAETDPEGRVPEPVRHTIQTALAKEPDARFQTAAEFQATLRALQPEHPVTVDDVTKALAEGHEIDTMPIRVRKPGSTQAKLDRQFGVDPTPPPVGGQSEEVEALRAVDETLRSPPPAVADPIRVRSLVAKAESLMDLGQQTQARHQLEIVLRLEPTNSAAQRLMEQLEETPPERDRWMDEIDSLLAGEQRKGRSKRTGSVQGQVQAGPDGAGESGGEGDVQRLLEEARDCVNAGRPEDAAQRLEHALIMQPENAAIREQLAVANAAVHDRREAEEHAQIEARAESIRDALASGRVDAAKAALAEAVEQLGDHEVLVELGVCIDQEVARRATVQSSCERARSLLADDCPADALAALSTALELDPSSSEIRELAAQCEARQAALETERETSSARETFWSQLAAGDVDGAALTLAALEERLPSGERERLAEELARAQSSRRSQELLQAGAKALDDGDVEEALQLLGRALTYSPEDLRANELFERAGEVQRRRRELDELLLSADESERAGNLNEAMQALERARELDAESREISERLQTVADRLVSSRRAARKAAELNAAVDQITAELQAHRFEPAKRAIDVAERVYGAVAQIVELRKQLEASQAKARVEAVAPLLARARQSAMVEDYDLALKALREARRAAPNHPEVEHLIEMYASSDRARRENQRQSRELTHAAVSIEALLSRGDREEAERALDLAEKMFGIQHELAQLRRRLEASVEVAVADPAATVEAALRALDAGHRNEAIRLLREVQQMAPDDSRVQGLLDEVMRREAEASIEAHLERGEMERARWTLELALGTYGRVGRLPRLEEEIDHGGA